MKRIISMLLVLALLCGAALAEVDYMVAADEIMQQLQTGEYGTVWAGMTAEMQQALPEDALAQTIASLGEIAEYGFAEEQQQDGYRIITYAAHQGANYFNYHIVLDAEGRLAGLQITPGSVPEVQTGESSGDVYTETVYLRPGAADETEAILTLPAAEGTFPAVILVHGSGPNDRDESVYGMTVFKDIAEGLARLGIASIRYDKYTYAHAGLCTEADFTIDQEYIADAAAALEILETDHRISGIYLAGHSQGGMLMPRIVAALGSERVDGGIAIAGSPLHMWQIQYAQNLTILEQLSGSERDEAQAVIDSELAKLDMIAGWTDEERMQNTLFGVNAYYQWDDMSYDAGELAAANAIPMLVLQGDCDWQVTPENGIEAWKQACPDADYIVLDNVTHMLNRVDSPTGTTADYVSGAKVDDAVIEAIANWIEGVQHHE